MAKYVDGFAFAIPKKNLKRYTKMARDASKVWKKHGALEYYECVGEDMKPKGVSFTFPQAVRAKKGELVGFAFIVYKSRAHRDRVNAKVMTDPALSKYQNEPMPFDMKHMAFGGFEVIVEM